MTFRAACEEVDVPLVPALDQTLDMLPMLTTEHAGMRFRPGATPYRPHHISPAEAQLVLVDFGALAAALATHEARIW